MFNCSCCNGSLCSYFKFMRVGVLYRCNLYFCGSHKRGFFGCGYFITDNGNFRFDRFYSHIAYKFAIKKNKTTAEININLAE